MDFSVDSLIFVRSDSAFSLRCTAKATDSSSNCSGRQAAKWTLAKDINSWRE